VLDQGEPQIVVARADGSLDRLRLAR